MTEFVNDNGQRLQYGGDDVTFTKQIASFRDFKIKGDFTVSFTIDNNSVNRKALGYFGIQQIGNHAFAANKFNLIRDGNFSAKGNIIIEDDDGEKIGCYFVSGNANWFNSFDFPANQINNTTYNVYWDVNGITGTFTKTYGIVFPVIDFAFYRQKYDKNFLTAPFAGSGDAFTLDTRQGISKVVNTGIGVTELYPCLYIHTLIQELARTANIRIGGNLLNDQLYNSLVMTPAGPDLYDQSGNVITSYYASVSAGYAQVIPISAIPDPNLKAIDVIKWLCFSFGCIPTFDEFSQTLSLDMLDKVQKENADDWSDYFQGFQIKYSNFFENNYIHAAAPSEDELKVNYNPLNIIPYGEINIKSKKSDGSSIDLYTSPFAPVKDDIGGPLKWATPFVQFIKLTDSETFTYTSVANDGAGHAKFVGDFSGSQFLAGGGGTLNALCIKVIDDNGTYSGYILTNLTSAQSTAAIIVEAPFLTTSTGTLVFQSVEKQKTGNRILSCISSLLANNVISGGNISFGNAAVGGVKTTVAGAYYSKPIYPYSDLNNYQKGLSYGEINLPTYNDISLNDSYFNKINTFLRNPPLYAFFTLPERVFSSWDFTKFIYIKNEELTGYFFVEAIENYKDDTTVVRCTLNYADGYSGLTGYNTVGVKAGYPDVDMAGNAVGYDSSVDYDKFDTSAD